MSTTWVFLGLLAGREFVLSAFLEDTHLKPTTLKVCSDAGKALIGLVVSIALAVGLPWIGSTFIG